MLVSDPRNLVPDPTFQEILDQDRVNVKDQEPGVSVPIIIRSFLAQLTI
jgi:hypothetical protein